MLHVTLLAVPVFSILGIVLLFAFWLFLIWFKGYAEKKGW